MLMVSRTMGKGPGGGWGSVLPQGPLLMCCQVSRGVPQPPSRMAWTPYTMRAGGQDSKPGAARSFQARAWNSVISPVFPWSEHIPGPAQIQGQSLSLQRRYALSVDRPQGVGTQNWVCKGSFLLLPVLLWLPMGDVTGRVAGWLPTDVLSLIG